jgi:muramidase (phage lysozyme)
MDNTIDPQVKNLVSAIGAAETGAPSDSAYTTEGASGEYGRYQFMPDTWKQWAGQILGDPNAPMSMENQNKVAYTKVKQWKDQGLNPAQIASKWNSGDENAYLNQTPGVNNEGVSYNTPAYTQKVSSYYRDLSSGNPINYNPTPTTNTDQNGVPIQNNGGQPTQPGSIWSKIGNFAKNAVAGSTIQFGQDTGAALAAPGNEKLYEDSLASWQDIQNRLNQTIAKQKAAGLDTSKLEASLQQHTAAMPKLEDFTGNVINKTPEQIAGEGIGTVMEAAQGGLLGGLGEAAAGKDLSLGAKIAQGAKVGAGYGAVGGLASGMTQGEGAGGVALNTALGAGLGGTAGGALGLAGGVASKLIPKDTNFATNPDEFISTYDKAVPPTKADLSKASTMERAQGANNLMHYIVQNYETLGSDILDKNGEVKLPSKYTMQDSLQALDNAFPQIYKEYTGALSGADMQTFTENVQQKTGDIISSLDSELKSRISTQNQGVIKTILAEVNSDQMRTATPETLYEYIKDLGRRAFAGNMTEGKAILADTAGKLNNILDSSLDETDAAAFKNGKGLYRAAKLQQNRWTRAALKELKNTPGLEQKLANMGMTVEGIEFLITHDPHTIAMAAGLKGASMFSKWLNSSEGALSDLYKPIEKEVLGQAGKTAGEATAAEVATPKAEPQPYVPPTSKPSFFSGSTPTETPNQEGGFATGKAIAAGAGVAGATALATSKSSASYTAPATSTSQSPAPKSIATGYSSQEIADAIANNETGSLKGKDPYSFSKPSGVKAYGKDLGKYQITSARLKEMSKQFLGRTVTDKEFLANPKLQDAFIIAQINWQKAHNMTDAQIFATHRAGWGYLTSKDLEKAQEIAKSYSSKGMSYLKSEKGSQI